MLRKLVRVGNSRALVVDRWIIQKLGIGEESRFRVTLDGERMIVELIRPAAVEAAQLAMASVAPNGASLAVFDAKRVLDELENKYGMEPKDFAALHHRGKLHSYRFDLEVGRSLDTDEDRRSMERLDACLGELRAGSKWEQAIDAARAKVPGHTAS